MRIAILPLAALALLSAPAIAGTTADDTVTVRIGYGDVDVTSAEGRAALEARIDSQVRKACTIEGVSRYAYGRSAVDSKCVAEARIAALAEVERVAALEARNGRAIAAN